MTLSAIYAISSQFAAPELSMTLETARSGQLCRDFILNPITALAFFTARTDGRLYLLAGEDNQLKVYDTESTYLCGQITVFKAQAIHGISVSPASAAKQQILIWGGYSVTVLPGDVLNRLLSGEHGEGALKNVCIEATAPDWLLDGTASPYANGGLALLTAHNELIHGHFDEAQNSVVFDAIRSPSRPILFSGTLSWESPSCILVAAGTVFGEIVVWKYHASSEASEARCDIHFVFSGHEGSIFGVCISPRIQLENGETLTLLASCSDDRTIRVWDVTEVREAPGDRHASFYEKISAARQTGFGDSLDCAGGETETTRCLAVAMGHASRIWNVAFSDAQPTTDGPSGLDVVLWSFGEDATAQKWLFSHRDRGPSSTLASAQLSHQGTFANHVGKHIWSHAQIQTADEELLIATGGSDSKVSLLSASDNYAPRYLAEIPTAAVVTQPPECEVRGDIVASALQHQDEKEAEELDTGSSATVAPPNPQTQTQRKGPKVKKTKETFNHYNFLSESCLLAVTNSGRLFRGTFETELSWYEVALPAESHSALRSYTVITSLNDGRRALIGTASGAIFLYRDADVPTVEPLAQVAGKVAGLFDVSREVKQREQPRSLDPSGHGPAKAEEERGLFLVDILGSSDAVLLQIRGPGQAVEVTETKVHLDKAFGITAAALCGDILLLGSRKGVITVLQPTQDGYRRAETEVEATIKDAVTSISILSRVGGQPTTILTTSRDGKYRIHQVSRRDDCFHLWLLHETTPPFGPIIEDAWFFVNADGTKDLMLCGFRSKNFVVWNETRAREIVTVDCGGAHRMFAYMPLSASADAFRFVFTKTSQLCVFSQSHAPHRTVKEGGHGREIRAVASSGQYVATAAEDTTIRIWSYDAVGTKLRCLAMVEKHTTGIQALKWHGQSRLFSSGGNEEFFVWRTTPLQSEHKELGIVCEAVFPDRTEVGDLRIMDFDVRCLDDDHDGPDASVAFLVSMIFSDSSLKTYRYSKDGGFRILARGSYTGACMTQLRYLHADHHTVRALTAATDGYLAVWQADMPGGTTDVSATDFATLAMTRLHQSTMKSLDVREVDGPEGKCVLVVAGGDDNALGMAQLRQDGTGRFVFPSKCIVRSAHAAAITGVAILDGTLSPSQAVVVSTGNDQKVAKWRIADWQGASPRIQLLYSGHSSVADAGDLEQLPGDRVVVGGVGLEMWNAGGPLES